MEIEWGRRCNFNCSYCDVPPESKLTNELRPKEMKDVIDQAKARGASRIIIIGGEPRATLLYPVTYNFFTEMIIKIDAISVTKALLAKRPS